MLFPVSFSQRSAIDNDMYLVIDNTIWEGKWNLFWKNANESFYIPMPYIINPPVDNSEMIRIVYSFKCIRNIEPDSLAR